MSNTLHTTEPECLAYTADDLARLLNCSKRHIAGLNSSGRLPAPIRLGRSVRWLADEIRDWLEAGAPPRDRWEAVRNNPDQFTRSKGSKKR